ncbi:MAG: DUF3021 domain-containing protein [Firmicutes bacterium]|nr:DUF3021 domain-containing protein [Bacillota bacterium]
MKKAILRGLIGFPIGVTIGYSITIVISLIFAEGYYSPAVPSMIEMCGSEINAVLIQFLLCGLMGFIFAAGSVVWESEKLSLLAQTAINFVIVTGTMLPVAYICHWMEHSIAGLLQYVAIFAIIYVTIWITQYISYKIRIRKINKKIESK